MLRRWLLTAVPLLLVAGCGAADVSGDDVENGELDVVVAFYPFQFVAERVAGPHATITSLTLPGAEPHDLELTPKQVASVADADLVVYEQGFQAAVDAAVTQTGSDNALDTTTVVPLVPFEDEHEHGDEHAEAGHDHEEGAAEEAGLDPHVWLDPANLAIIATAVGAQLSATDPDHASDYRTNADSLVADLTDLDDDFTTGLKTCQQKEFITNHAAFGYLARKYGLEQIGISGLSPDAEPSASRIAEIHAEAREHGVTTIFTETLVSPAVADSIAGDLGLKTDVLDPLEGITDQSEGTDYLEVMRANLQALTTANRCR